MDKRITQLNLVHLIRNPSVERLPPIVMEEVPKLETLQVSSYDPSVIDKIPSQLDFLRNLVGRRGIGKVSCCI